MEVAYTLNYHRAADNLFISQPPLSYQIQTLEEEIGFAVFRRSAKGTGLTPPVPGSARIFPGSAFL